MHLQVKKIESRHFYSCPYRNFSHRFLPSPPDRGKLLTSTRQCFFKNIFPPQQKIPLFYVDETVKPFHEPIDFYGRAPPLLTLKRQWSWWPLIPIDTARCQGIPWVETQLLTLTMTHRKAKMKPPRSNVLNIKLYNILFIWIYCFEYINLNLIGKFPAKKLKLNVKVAFWLLHVYLNFSVISPHQFALLAIFHVSYDHVITEMI